MPVVKVVVLTNEADWLKVHWEQERQLAKAELVTALKNVRVMTDDPNAPTKKRRKDCGGKKQAH